VCRGNAVVIIKRIHVTDALAIILNFYGYQVALGLANYLDPITDVSSRSLFFFFFFFFCFVFFFFVVVENVVRRREEEVLNEKDLLNDDKFM